MQTMYYIGLDVHKRTISYCVKDASGRIYAEGSLPATRLHLDRWMKTLRQPWTAAMEVLHPGIWIHFDPVIPHSGFNLFSI
jgi:transposase